MITIKHAETYTKTYTKTMDSWTKSQRTLFLHLNSLLQAELKQRIAEEIARKAWWENVLWNPLYFL